MYQITEHDRIALERSVQADLRVMQLIAQLSPEQCQELARKSLERRMAFVFDLLTNDCLQSVANGGFDMAGTCAAMLKNR